MSRMASTKYEIGRVADRCAGSGEPLGPGDPFVAALIETPGDGGLQRHDYRLAVWESTPRPARLFASWRGVVPTGAPSGKPTIDAESLLGLFEQLEEAVDEKRLAFRYVLALILLRKRALTPAGSRDASASRPAALLVRARHSPPDSAPIEVLDPAMDEATLADITEQLRGLLRIDA